MDAWIKTVSPEAAEGLVAELYKQSGSANVIRAHSPLPEAMCALLEMFRKGIWTNDHLTLVEREMIATVVSKLNECHY